MTLILSHTRGQLKTRPHNTLTTHLTPSQHTRTACPHSQPTRLSQHALHAHNTHCTLIYALTSGVCRVAGQSAGTLDDPEQCLAACNSGSCQLGEQHDNQFVRPSDASSSLHSTPMSTEDGWMCHLRSIVESSCSCITARSCTSA